MNQKILVRNIVCFILILSIGISSAQVNVVQQQQVQQQQDETQTFTIIIGAVVTLTAVFTFIAIALTSKAHKQEAAEEAKFQACVGKTKSEIYTIYGPPDSIVDDGQGLGGAILEYHKVVASSDGNNGVYTITYRKLFYLNKENIVTAVKKDSN